MSQTAGLLLVAVAVLWIAYLVPHRLRYRQQLAECRNDDRFSDRLRVVRVATSGARPPRQDAATGGRVLLHPPGRGGGAVDRPHRPADRLVADAVRRTAAERAARAAHLARRRARARRRATLAGLLALATVAGWAGVVAGGVLALGLAPLLLLSTVLVLGRRAVVAGHRADTAWAAGAQVRAATPRSTRAPTAVGHARRPSDASTEVIARIAADDDAVADADAGADGAVAAAETEGATWAPVPVPRPSYALKPAVRRAEPSPLVLDERAEPAGGAAPGEEPAQPAEPARAAAQAGFDLDAVLARRRAAGE